ncbi:hypothetical protein Glove_253g70 [Diversispora epigaea]|uniref:DUF1664 domain-containing protein n=1 Tax=Diversispora epigaea TaxID=1348612 RepID=A0A397IBX6_9GLOM|nr:hypothetical protein Glove_253g70 [Diversispora epigaea]
MIKHPRRILPTVKRLARQYFIPSKDDSVASSVRASDIIHYGAFVGTGAVSLYGIWRIINTTIEQGVTPVIKKLDNLDAKLDAKLDNLDAKLDKLDAKLDARLDKLDAKLERLDANVMKLGAIVKELDSSVKGLDASVKKLDVNVNFIKGYLMFRKPIEQTNGS